ncbi:DNA primase [Spiroplasma endosymbiont of Danaus chrysippus]|uniref:DNA primase n=1 Tax=Spiroplasma endosymbiont of Danaus chrysippus TaxID=2691041 RepID=UPI00157B77CF|nr:DNA primase [Spiroplasma endosymbiont of Danaus chrysippus]
MDIEFNKKINEVKAKINIVEVMGKYLNLIRKGNNFWAICPFHEDSTPSLSISQEKQIYKCFSCGEQGNVFIFLQKYKNINFINALKEAADNVNLNLKEFDINLSEFNVETKKNPLKILNNIAMNFFSYQLLTDIGQEAMKYLQNRNITTENIKYFNIGYAPINNELIDYLNAQGYKDNIEFVKLGLMKINNKDQLLPTFSNRIMFAIKDEDGDCVGFSARNYNREDKSYKYINSPETDFFKKSKILYNFNNVKNYIKKNEVIYLTEGFMDVIALNNQNIKNVVALMGTNLTKEHILLLKKITINIIIFLDGDLPGKIASLKIASVLLSNNFKVQIINNDTKFDPDELINKFPQKFYEIIKKTIHPFEFAINLSLTKYNIKKDSYELNEFLKSLVPIWTKINDVITQKFYLNMLAKITNLSTEDLIQILNINNNLLTTTFSIKNKSKIEVKNIFFEAQEQLIFLVMLSKNVYLILEKEKFIFPNQDFMNLYFLISQKYQNNQIEAINFDLILEELKGNSLLNILEKLLDKYKNKKFDLKPQIINDYLKIINNQLIDYEIKMINDKLKSEKNIEKQILLLKEISVLKNKIKKK